MAPSFVYRTLIALLLWGLVPGLAWSARLFNDASTERLDNTTSAPVTAVPLTICALFKVDDNAIDHMLVQIQDKDSATNLLGIQAPWTVANDPVRAVANSGGGLFNSSINTGGTTGVWRHVCGRFPATTSRFVCLGTTGCGTEGTQTVTPTGLDSLTVGAAGDSTPNQYLSGDIAEVNVWSVSLSADQTIALSKGFTPHEIGNLADLVFRADLIRNLNDAVGGRNLTATGTTVSVHPRMSRRLLE
jgi:hypothetical protein